MRDLTVAQGWGPSHQCLSHSGTCQGPQGTPFPEGTAQEVLLGRPRCPAISSFGLPTAL